MKSCSPTSTKVKSLKKPKRANSFKSFSGNGLGSFIKGFESLEFAIAAGLALVVMYDAAGIRRAAGKMAVTLNKMMDVLDNKIKKEKDKVQQK